MLEYSKIESYDDILNIISETNIKGLACKRIIGFKVKEDIDFIEIFSWQCNLADIKGYDIKLPTVVVIKIKKHDEKIIDIELGDNFKGSQGLPCSRKFLDRKLKSELLNEDFRLNNKKLQDPILLACRHIHELVIGAVSFYENYKKTQMDFYFENTCAKIVDEGIVFSSFINYMEKEVILNTKFNFKANDISFNKNGELEKIKYMGITSTISKEGEGSEVPIYKDNIEELEEQPGLSISLMKIFSKIWRKLGYSFNLSRNFYFSNIWAPSMYGIFVQAISLFIHSGNYAYFQYAIFGLQNGSTGPKCIGIVKDYDEALKFFPDFKVEDIYG